MKKKLLLVSIITPIYRSEYYLPSFIKSLNQIRFSNFEVIMVFDPSPDQSFEVAKKLTHKMKNCHLILNKKHLGISKSLNLGIRKSKGKYIAFFMTDMIVDSLCISKMVDFIENADKSVGVVVAKTLDYHKHSRIQAYQMYLMPQTGFLYIPEYGHLDGKKYNRPFIGFTGIDGSMFKKEVFKKTGMFDIDIDLSINDLDMIWRTWLAGYKVIRIPTAKVYHWSLKMGRGGEKWEFTYAKMMDLFIQNYSLKYLLIYLPQFLVIYTARSLITLMMGNPDPLKGWIRSIIWSIFYLPKALKKRKVIQGQVRVVSDEYLHEIIFTKLSLWEFYRHLRKLQKNVTKIMMTTESKDERILTYSK